MNDPSIALESSSPLVGVVEDFFSPRSLEALLGPSASALGVEVWDAALRSPLVQFLDRPSKEFRSGLVLTSYALAGGRGACPEVLPQIVEILHAGSLIVDDIQDQSSTRRGGPALHLQVGLPVALNAGNWLYFLAFDLLDQLEVKPGFKLEAYRCMSRQLLQCHNGQGLDLTARLDDLEQSSVHELVLTSTRLKTGALMKLSAMLGALAAEASTEVVTALGNFGERLGVGLQMLDDTGGLLSAKRCHKGHEDLRLARPTWPWAWLADELPARSYEQLRKSAAQVRRGDLHPEVVARALRTALQGSGRVRARRAIHAAFVELRATFGASSTLERMESEMRRMERSYG